MSLERLDVVGALDDSLYGLEMLARVGTSHHLTQPHWEFYPEPRAWNPATLRQVKEAQKMLRDYGQILVNEGWLAE